MGDYACIHCQDNDDQCERCSFFWHPDVVHTKCGYKWKEHQKVSQPHYAPFTRCPPFEGPSSVIEGRVADEA